MANPDLIMVRCHRNPFNTDLFSFDRSGLYVKCKDCRQKHPPYKRGVWHKFHWGEVLKMMMGFWRQPHNALRESYTGSDHSKVESEYDPIGDGDESGDGGRDSGGPVDGDSV